MFASLLLAETLMLSAAAAGYPPPMHAPPSPPAPQPLVGQPDPASNPARWIHGGDYPKAARGTGAQGMTNIRLHVDETGKPARCDIMRSSGYPVLDAHTCNLLMARARFLPARDADGKPAGALYSQSVRWIAPD